MPAWCAALKRGDIVAAPAEGVYGYCCDPFNTAALERLMTAKQRSPNKGLIVLVNDTAQLERLCPLPFTASEQEAIATLWDSTQPPTTLILPALPSLSPLLTGGRDTLAIRRPNSPYMQEYLAAWGHPLVSTSFNLSGEAPATEAAQIPADIPALTLPKPLSGTPSRIYSPATRTWLR